MAADRAETVQVEGGVTRMDQPPARPDSGARHAVAGVVGLGMRAAVGAAYRGVVATAGRRIFDLEIRR